MKSEDSRRVVRDATPPIRVLLWLPDGMHRAIVMSALEQGENVEVLDTLAPQGEPGERQQLLAAASRLRPSVVVLSASRSEMQRVAEGLGGMPAVFVSADGRSALAYDADVNAATLVRMVRSLAPSGSTSDDTASLVRQRGEADA